ncbi:MAG: ABC transporter permease [Blastocatellia bacterium]|nr:ABC transporter permease [Blastocatellia bacterium]
MDTLLQELRYAIRSLAKKPGLTLIIALTMALGIGANTAVFSVVNAFLLRPLPYKDSDRLVRIRSEFNGKEEGVSFLDYRDWREQSRSFEEMVFFNGSWLPNLNLDAETETPQAVLTTWNLFEVLGVKPLIGRSFLAEDDLPASEKVALISYGLWQRRFGSDPNIAGREMRIDSVAYKIIGVMPPGFKYPSQSELWVPAGRWFDQQNRGVRIDKVIARLKPDVSIAQAESEMSAVARGLAEKHPDTNKGVGATLIPERELWVGDLRASLLSLFCACGFVLLIACANVANLLLARAGTRQKEMAIRQALGARRFRLVRQLLTESILIALIGGVFGLLLALWGMDLLLAAIPVELPFWVEIKIDGYALGFTFAVSILTGVFFGLVPAFQTTRVNLSRSLKEGSKSSDGERGSRARRLLVVSEIALALLLLVGAGLMMKSFIRLQELDPGFEAKNALVLGTSFSYRDDFTSEQWAVAFDQVIKRIEALPGVEAVGANSDLPFIGQEPWDRIDFTIEGQSHEEYERNPLANWQSINPGYFRAMGIPLIRGRFFTEQDAASDLIPIIISRNMAETYWPGQDPLGKRMKAGDPDSDDRWSVVVGVVGDVRHDGLLKSRGFDMYGAYRRPWKEMHLVVRTKGGPMGIAAAVRKEIWSVSTDLGVNEVLPLEKLVANSIWQPRLWGMLLAVFSTVALVLAAAGIYGVVSYMVSRRTREIGIRMVLGARPADVLKLVLKESLGLISAGLVVGLTGAFTLTRAIASQLHEVSATDAPTFIGVSVLLIAVALIASFLPARRAAKVDPCVALRYE